MGYMGGNRVIQGDMGLSGVSSEFKAFSSVIWGYMSVRGVI